MGTSFGGSRCKDSYFGICIGAPLLWQITCLVEGSGLGVKGFRVQALRFRGFSLGYGV